MFNIFGASISFNSYVTSYVPSVNLPWLDVTCSAGIDSCYYFTMKNNVYLKFLNTFRDNCIVFFKLFI